MYVQFILLIPFLVDLATRFRRIGGNYIGMEGDITGIWAQAIWPEGCPHLTGLYC